MFYTIKIYFFNNKKTSASKSASLQQQTFSGENECVTSYVFLPAPLALKFNYPKTK